MPIQFPIVDAPVGAGTQGDSVNTRKLRGDLETTRKNQHACGLETAIAVLTKYLLDLPIV